MTSGNMATAIKVLFLFYFTVFECVRGSNPSLRGLKRASRREQSRSSSDQQLIVLPSKAMITKPRKGSKFDPGETIELAGLGFDPYGGGKADPNGFKWKVTHHKGNDQHTIFEAQQATPFFSAPESSETGEGDYLEISLTVIDVRGSSTTTSLEIYPEIESEPTTPQPEVITTTQAEVTTTPEPEVLTSLPTPVDLIVKDVSRRKVTLSWKPPNDVANVVGYIIYRDDEYVAKVDGSSETKFTDSDLVVSTTYTYSVRCVNDAGNVSPLSNEAYVKTLSKTGDVPPSRPENLQASNIQLNQVTFQWVSPPNGVKVDGYNIFQRIEDSVMRYIDTVRRVTRYTATNLAPDTTYHWQVVAFTRAGNFSPFSSDLTAKTSDVGDIVLIPTTPASTTSASTTPASTTPASTPPAPSTGGSTPNDVVDPPKKPKRLKATDVQSSSVALSWKKPKGDEDINGYNIYRNGIMIGWAGREKHTDHGLAAGTTYDYIVRTVDEENNVSQPSNEVSVTTRS